MKIKNAVLAPVVVAAFVIGIGLSMMLNLWQTESSKTPAMYKDGELAGTYNPADIRGSFSFGDIENAFGIDSRILAEAFGINEEAPEGFLLKGLEDIYAEVPDGGDIGTDAVKLFVASYNGLSFTVEETTRLPASAKAILKQRMPAGDFAGIQDRFVEPVFSGDSPEKAAEPEPAGEEKIVKGNTTFGDLTAWGLSKETVESVIGKPMGPAGTTVRDFATAEGLEFSEYKERFQQLLDALP